MVDLTKRPFYLNEAKVKWVEDTLASMTFDEKVGQLFINLTTRKDPAYITELCEKYHIGGVRWQGGTPEQVYEQNKLFQEKSKVPVLIAANCEAGGNSLAAGGTLVATGPACGASTTTDTIRDMARVGAEEATSIGCNWTFAPICDVVSNWRNTIVNNRAYGNDPDWIIQLSKTYMDEMKKHNMACAAKHFPGDGSEERDQHLVMGCNDLSVEEWDASYGKVYQALIDADLPSIMVGHICQPAYTRYFNPSIEDKDIKPGTLQKELLQDLLRGKLGFNGLIVTDASHMAGLTAGGSRKEIVPGVIAAGCDMVLFFNDPAEDIEYMKAGLASGQISEERFSDALHRILGMKAMLGLDNLKFPPKEGISAIGAEEHHQAAYKAADESITLVKDTQKVLPILPSEKKRIMLYYVESAPESLGDGPDKGKQILIDELTAAGFEVTAPKDYYEREMEKYSPFNKFAMMEHRSMEQFKKDYDLVLVVLSMKGYAQTNNVRVTYSVGHSYEIPWSVYEVPTIGISLNYTNHLYDVPMLKTFINAYAPTKEYIHALVEKLTGKKPFKGQYNDLVWCDRWETRL